MSQALPVRITDMALLCTGWTTSFGAAEREERAGPAVAGAGPPPDAGEGKRFTIAQG